MAGSGAHVRSMSGRRVRASLAQRKTRSSGTVDCEKAEGVNKDVKETAMAVTSDAGAVSGGRLPACHARELQSGRPWGRTGRQVKQQVHNVCARADSSPYSRRGRRNGANLSFLQRGESNNAQWQVQRSTLVKGCRGCGGRQSWACLWGILRHHEQVLAQPVVIGIVGGLAACSATWGGVLYA